MKNDCEVLVVSGGVNCRESLMLKVGDDTSLPFRSRLVLMELINAAFYDGYYSPDNSVLNEEFGEEAYYEIFKDLASKHRIAYKMSTDGKHIEVVYVFVYKPFSRKSA